MNYSTKDSGERVLFETGAQRDRSRGKGRWDLLPWPALERLAKLMERGAAKYGERNWEQGIPLSRMFESGIRHAYQWWVGQNDEDHLAAVLFNFGSIMLFEMMIKAGGLPPELDNRPGYLVEVGWDDSDKTE